MILESVFQDYIFLNAKWNAFWIFNFSKFVSILARRLQHQIGACASASKSNSFVIVTFWTAFIQWARRPISACSCVRRISAPVTSEYQTQLTTRRRKKERKEWKKANKSKLVCKSGSGCYCYQKISRNSFSSLNKESSERFLAGRGSPQKEGNNKKKKDASEYILCCDSK